MKILKVRELRVLLVDESGHMRQLLMSMLYGMGVRGVVQEDSFKGAFDMIDAGRVDMVVTEQNIRGGSGIELIRKIRTESIFPETPVIMLTGAATRSVTIGALNAGVDEFLVKPISPANLHSRIIAAIEAPRDFVRKGDYYGPTFRDLKVGDATRRGLVSPPPEARLIAA